jgi:hypothetical protein
MIILNLEQKNFIDNVNLTFGYDLIPVALVNGTEWVLPIEVLRNEGYKLAWEYLSKLPQREVLESEYPKTEL